MIQKIFNALFVFAILFGNISTPAAMTLEEYWGSTNVGTNVWNIWVKAEYSYLDNYIYNVRCKTSTDNPCCAYLDEKFIGTEQKVYVAAYYPNDTQEEDTASSTPTTCEYTSNACFSCDLQWDSEKQKVTGKCLPNNEDDNEDVGVTCPLEHKNYATCEVNSDHEEPYNIDDKEILIYGTTCSTCPQDTTQDKNNFCCPKDATCTTQEDGTSMVQCNAGYYKTTNDNGKIMCTECPAGSDCPAGTTEPECLYTDDKKDTAENILNWLRDACPLATDTKAITEITISKSWKKYDTTCYADITIDTTCGRIVKEAVPMTNGKYLTWDNGAEIRPDVHYYRTLKQGLHANTLYSPEYCTTYNSDTPEKYQLYKKAVICPAGTYCLGYSNTPKCPEDGTNPTQYPPNGLVAAGYYSTGGAYSSTPNKSGDGCLSGYNCGQCPAGAQSNAGASSCSTCSDGTYSNASGATTCTNCEKGYYCTNGNRYKCPAGSTSDAGQPAITGCYIMGGAGGTGFCVNSKCFNIQSDVKAYYSGNTSQ